MTDYETRFGDLIRRMTDAEKELLALKRDIWGDLPSPFSLASVNERIEAVERSVVVAAAAVQGMPSVAGGGVAFSDAEEVITDIEYGKVKTAPTSTDSATIVLRPCDKAGTEYASAADVTVYVRRDRSAIDQVGFKWTTSTILTWLRFASDIGSAPAVSGIVLGGDEAGPGTPTVVCGSATPTFDATQVAMDNFGRVAGWYEYDWCADTWTWNAGPWGYSDPGLRP